MGCVLLALLCFMAAIAAHIFYCRRAPRSGLHAKAFVGIAFVLLCAYVSLALAIGHAGLLDPPTLWGKPFVLTGIIIFVLLVPAYLTFYVMTMAVSPSRKIVSVLAARGALSYGEVLEFVRQEDFVQGRMNDLCVSGCVIEHDGKYVLGFSGRLIAGISNLMQRILGREMGG